METDAKRVPNLKEKFYDFMVRISGPESLADCLSQLGTLVEDEESRISGLEEGLQYHVDQIASQLERIYDEIFQLETYLEELTNFMDKHRPYPWDKRKELSGISDKDVGANKPTKHDQGK